MKNLVGGENNDMKPVLQLPELRSLDDFILASARFQLPNLKDFEKWGNRVVNNLIYYQSNYFLLFICTYLLIGILNPSKILCGVFVKAVILMILLKFFNDESARSNPLHKWYYLGSALFSGYLLLYWFDAFILSTFALLLPFSLTFIHASLRLRNIKNKVANAIGIEKTPMGKILSAVNIKADVVFG